MRYLDMVKFSALLHESAGNIRKKIRANSNEMPQQIISVIVRWSEGVCTR